MELVVFMIRISVWVAGHPEIGNKSRGCGLGAWLSAGNVSSGSGKGM